MTYAKLFSSIIASTIWNEPPTTCKVWITMLAMKDRDGVVEGSIPGLAVLARVSVKECVEALSVLSSPDPDSRTQTKQGRRIEPADGGWQIINHDLYQTKGSSDEQKEKTRLRVERHRARKAAAVTVGNDVQRSVTPKVTLGLRSGLRSRSRSSEIPEGAGAPVSSKLRAVPDADRPDDVSEDVWRDWVAHRKHKRAPVTARVITKTRADAKAAGMTMDEALTHWVSQGYVGFFPPAKGSTGSVTGKPRPIAVRVASPEELSGPTISTF